MIAHGTLHKTSEKCRARNPRARLALAGEKKKSVVHHFVLCSSSVHFLITVRQPSPSTKWPAECEYTSNFIRSKETEGEGSSTSGYAALCGERCLRALNPPRVELLRLASRKKKIMTQKNNEEQHADNFSFSQTARSTRSALVRPRTGCSTSCPAPTPPSPLPVLTSSATACP